MCVIASVYDLSAAGRQAGRVHRGFRGITCNTCSAGANQSVHSVTVDSQHALSGTLLQDGQPLASISISQLLSSSLLFELELIVVVLALSSDLFIK